MALLVISNRPDGPDSECERMFFDGAVSDADLLLALDGHGEFGGLFGGVGAGSFHRHAGHLATMASMVVGVCLSGCAFLHDRYEVHGTDGAFVGRALLLDRRMHRAGVVVDIGGFSGRAGLFAPSSEQERKEREREEKKRSS